MLLYYSGINFVEWRRISGARKTAGWEVGNDGESLSRDLRERAVGRVAAGESVRSVAAVLQVSASSTVKWPQRFRATGSAAASAWPPPPFVPAASRVPSRAHESRQGLQLARPSGRTRRTRRLVRLPDSLALAAKGRRTHNRGNAETHRLLTRQLQSRRMPAVPYKGRLRLAQTTAASVTPEAAAW